MSPMIPANDRCRSSLSEMVLYADHPCYPIHAALFSNYDATYSLVVCGRSGEEAGRSVVVSLIRDNEPFGMPIHLTLRCGKGLQPTGKVTIDDFGQLYTGIQFEPERPAFTSPVV